MQCLLLIDVLVFIASFIFFVTAFPKEDCYSASCPKAIKPWLLLIFTSFYLLQLATYAMFKTKNRQMAFWVWSINSFLICPGLLALNIWGNMLIEGMDNEPECTYVGYAQSFQMLYLISTYCVVFVYLIFLLTIKETLKRYYAFMDRTPEQMNQRLNLHAMNVPLVRGRSYRDWCDALSYSLYLIHAGRIGSRAERDYIDAERAARQYRLLSSSIKDFVFEEGEGDDDGEEITPMADGELGNDNYGLDDVTPGGKFAINDEEIGAPSPKEALLNSSFRSSSSRRSSVSSQASSVTPRADGRNVFKYKCCSICLTDFTQDEKVKVLPNCGHTFHGECLEQWLVRQFRCPNCNQDITAPAGLEVNSLQQPATAQVNPYYNHDANVYNQL